MTWEIRLAVAAGIGRLSRRETSLLFLPEPDPTPAFIECHTDASPDDVIGAIIARMSDRPQDIPSFVLVAWSQDDRISVLVHGDATITTDLASLPEISGAESDTLVEHPVPADFDSMVLRSGDDPLAATELTSGVVPAGGFDLVLRRAAVGTPRTEQELEDEVRPNELPSHLRAAVDWMEESLHLDQPTRTDVDRVVTVDVPLSAEVVLPDGSSRPLTATMVVGRRPTPAGARLGGDSDAIAIAVKAPASMSRTHVLLTGDSSQSFVTDCGSRGGTALVPAGESDAVPLEPWIAREWKVGDRLYLGGPTMIEMRAMVGRDRPWR